MGKQVRKRAARFAARRAGQSGASGNDRAACVVIDYAVIADASAQSRSVLAAAVNGADGTLLASRSVSEHAWDASNFLRENASSWAARCVPVTLLVDSGIDWTSGAFQKAAREFGFEVHHGLGRQPRLSAMMERQLRALQSLERQLSETETIDGVASPRKT